MFPSNGVFDPAFMQVVCNAAIDLMSPSPTTSIMSDMQDGGWQPTRVYHCPWSQLLPSYALARNGGTTVVVIGGSPTIAACNAIYQGYYPPMGWMPGESVNSYISNAIPGIFGTLMAWNGQIPENLYLYGHSIGGCLCQALMGLFEFVGVPRAQINCASTGSPRFVGGSAADAFGRYTNNARWMYRSDPIPYVPPRLADVPAIGPVIGPRNVTRFETFRHVIGGLVIADNATISGGDLPGNGLGNFRVAVAAMMNQADVDINAYHSLLTYRDFFRRMVERRFAPGPQPAVREEPAPGVGGGEFRAVERQVVAAVRAQGQAQQQQTVELPAGRNATWRRSGNLWIVEFGGQFVSSHNRRLAAEDAARLINNLLRRGLHSSVFDYQSLVKEIIRFFTDSKDPTTGIKPAVADEFPAVVPH